MSETTEELERLVAQSERGQWPEKERLSAMALTLAREVLAGRKALTAIKADKCYCYYHHDDAEDAGYQCPHEIADKALAALGVPDGE